MSTWKGTAIRSITIDYDDLSGFMGRNPKGIYHGENLVKAVRDAVRRGSDIYVHDSPEGPRHRLTPGPDEGTLRFGEGGETGRAAADEQRTAKV